MRTWAGSSIQTTTLPYDPEIDGTVSVVVEVPVPTVTSTTTYDGSTISYTTVTAEPGETATVIEYYPGGETGEPVETGESGFRSRDAATETRTWTGTFTRISTFPYDSKVDKTITVIEEIPIPTITVTTTYDDSSISYTTVTAEPGETATIIEYHPGVYTGEAEILSGWESQLETEKPISSHESSGSKEAITVQEPQETRTEHSIISEQLLYTEGSLGMELLFETEHPIETEEQSGTEEVLPTTILQKLQTEKPFETGESPESKAIISTEILPGMQVLSETGIASATEQPDYTEEYSKNQPSPSTDVSFDNEIPAQTYVSFETEQVVETQALWVDTVTETQMWTGEFTQIYALPFGPEVAETITIIVEIPIPTVTITSTYEGSTISYTTFTADPGETATVIEFHPDEKTGEAEIPPGWERPFETETAPESEEQFRTTEGLAYVLQDTQIAQPVATEKVLEIEGPSETKEVIFTEAIPEPQVLSDTKVSPETLQPYNTEEVVEPQVLPATEAPLDTEIVDQSEVPSVTEPVGETRAYSVDTVTETRTWTGVFTQSITLSFNSEANEIITVIVEVPIPAVTMTTTYDESITSYTTILAEPGDTATVIEYIPVGETVEPAKIGESVVTPLSRFLDTLTETRTWTGDFTQSTTLPFDPQIDQAVTVLEEVPIPTVTITTTYDGATTSYTTVTVEPGETATVIEYVPVLASEEPIVAGEYIESGIHIESGELIPASMPIESLEHVETSEPIEPGGPFGRSLNVVTETRTWAGLLTQSTTFSFDFEVDSIITFLVEVPMPTVTITSTYDGLFISYTTMATEPGETVTIIEFVPETGIRVLETITETHTWTGLYTETITLPFDPEVDETVTVIVGVPIPTVTITSTYKGLTTSYTTIVAELGQTATIVEFVPENGSAFESSIPAETRKAETATIPGKSGVHSFDTVTETRTWTEMSTHSTTLPYNPEVDETVSVIIEVPIPTVIVTSTYDGSVTSYTTVLAEPGLTATVIKFIPDDEGRVGRSIDIVTVTRTWTGTFTQSTILPFDPDIDKTISVIVQIPIPTVTITREYTGTTVSYSTAAARPQGTSTAIVLEPSGEIGVPSETDSRVSETGAITKTGEWSSNFTKTTTSPFSSDIGKSVTAIIDVPIDTVTVTSTYQGNTKSYTTVTTEVGEIATAIKFVPRGSGGAGGVSRSPVDMGSGVSTKGPTGSTGTSVYNGISKPRASGDGAITARSSLPATRGGSGGNSGALSRPGGQISSTTTSIRAGAGIGAARSTGSTTRAGTKTGTQPRGRSTIGTEIGHGQEVLLAMAQEQVVEYK